MECPSCKAKLSDEATWCIACGAVIPQHTTVDATLIAESQLLEAARLRDAGLYADAISAYTRLIETTVDPTASAPLYESLGDCYRAAGDISSAANAYRQAVFLAPSDTLREKYDMALDQLRGVPVKSPSTAAKPNVAAPGNAANMVRFLSADAQGAQDTETEETHQPIVFQQLRAQLTPRMARHIIGAAVVMLLCSLLLIYRPWVQPPSAPTHVVPVQNAPSTTTPSLTSPTQAMPSANNSGASGTTALPATQAAEAGSNLGKNAHYVKTKTNVPSEASTIGGGVSGVTVPNTGMGNQ